MEANNQVSLATKINCTYYFTGPNNYEPIHNQREAPAMQTKTATKVSSINYYQVILDDATR